MPYERYELTDQDFELAQTYPQFVVTGIQIARATRYEFLPRHTSHVHPISAQAIRKIFQDRKRHAPFSGDELAIIEKPSLVLHTADKYEEAALELGILIELQQIGKNMDVASSRPVGDEFIARYKSTLES